MHNIMIVEDDVMYRYALRTVINWEEYGYIIDEEAINGQDAINKLTIKQPHVLITDISMPELDGIQLIQYVKQQYPQIKIIVLSSYDDYKFVRDALLLGAEDYILKVELEEDKLVRLLCNLRSDMEKENYRNSIVDENLLIKDIVTGDQKENIPLKLKKLKENFHPCVVMIIKYDQVTIGDDDYKKSVLFHEILNIKMRNYMLGFKDDLCYILIDTTSVKSESQIHCLLQEVGHYLIHELNREGIRDCQIGISDIFCSINTLDFYCNQAALALEHSYYDKDEKIFFYTNRVFIDQSKALDDLMDNLRKSTLDGEIDDVNKAITHIFEFVCRHKLNTYDLRKVLLDLYMLHHNITHELHLEYTGKTQVKELLIDKETHDVAEIEKEYQYCYNQLCKKIHDQKKYSIGVQRTLEYIDEYFRLSNLTVDEIANRLDITPNYLSNIFKKETGIKITEYINNLKMAEAKYLLRTSNKKVYEIANEVGFKNVTYFCTLFKRKSGVTVKEYRNQGFGMKS